jgi:hypothetical protein
MNTGATGSGGASGNGASTALGGAAGATPSCVSDEITPGSFPDPDTFCGETTGLTSQSASTFYPNDQINNGSTYAVAVVATDRVGNIGRLSEAACATPQPVTGFFERYKQSGGRAGRGCALMTAPGVSTAWLLALLGAIFTLRLERRRRRLR